ncbi:hypothetical protein PF010_g13040 [Phytophthora fragariae]|uniref:RxLR effector protein n=1 Tax=Phytophthora fragariae TaxID=53985 RepID=A0A6G0N509_9STRA|nr:hypothetical protein PF010_g13040 [Phytophthora fragariae]KAE9192159.1 hypothetical protein PF004_g21392 [Phytophthora fragariae]KAE9336707.1 hypothetical protein PF008_g12888 [Phytophthora fragariae]
MHFCCALLLTIVFTLLASSETLAVSRRLRAVDTDSPGPEDRGLASWLKSWSKVYTLDDALAGWRVTFWAKAGKSDEDVKKKLGIFYLTDGEMVAVPKYKYYLQFWFKTEEKRLQQWFTGNGIPTSKAWQLLRVDTLPAAQRERSAAYKAYKRYAKMYDDRLFQRYTNKESIYPIVPSYNRNIPYPEEMSGLVRMWVAQKRPYDYVMRVLGLSGHPSPKLDPAYKYLKEFKKLAAKKTM